MRWRWSGRPRVVTRVTEYRGESVIAVEATQLDDDSSASQATRVVDEWVAFFASGPSPLRSLHLVSRTPQRLFTALSGQTQLEELRVKWGDYSDLAPLSRLTRLRRLHVGGASSVEDVRPLARLNAVEDLSLEGLRRVRDLSPVAKMSAVVALVLGGDWMSPRVAHVDSFGFLREMPQLEHLLLHTIEADDKDYSPLLALPRLRSVRVMEVRGMRPSIEVIKASTPWKR